MLPLSAEAAEARGRRWWVLLIWGFGLVPLATGLVWPRPFPAPHPADLLGLGRLDLAIAVTRALTAGSTVLAGLALILAPRCLRRDLMGAALGASAGALAATLALAGLFGSRPALPLGVVAGLAGVAALVLLPPTSLERLAPVIAGLCRVYVYGSLAAMAVAWPWAVEQPYAQGWIPALPLRLHGLAVHANTTAAFAFVLLCLGLLRPPSGGWRRGCDLAAAALVLLLAQSKGFWLLAPLALAAALAGGLAGGWSARLSPGARWALFVAGLGLGLAALAIAAGPLGELLREREAAIATLTGRTRVWQATLALWTDAPWWGYGPALWDQRMAEERQGEMGWLVYQAHNQFVQTLGQSGLVGVTALVLHLAALLAAALLARPGQRALCLLLVAMVFLRSATEGWHRAVITPGGFLLWLLVLGCLLAALPRAGEGRPR